jgi:hypothetical protein
MAEGPTGTQGYQGLKGSRGAKGLEGWGYGTTTGPTGGIGRSVVVNINGDSETNTINGIVVITVQLSISNSGTLYQINDLDYSVNSFQSIAYSIDLTGQPSGIFWTFANKSKYSISVIPYSESSFIDGFRDYVDVDDSLTFVWNGTSLISI